VRDHKYEKIAWRLQRSTHPILFLGQESLPSEGSTSGGAQAPHLSDASFLAKNILEQAEV
jgi:hypothetical protein